MRGAPGKTIARALLLALLTLVAYLPALDNGFVWDDDDYVTENLSLRSPGGLARIWLEPRSSPQYYPLTLSVLWAQYQLWGPRPLGYHLLNVVLHAATSVLLWVVLRQLALPGAWLAAAVFALHPVHVESVAWVAELKNVLSGVFSLGALLSFLAFFGIDGPRQGAARETSPAAAPWRLYALGVALFACALLSKTVTGTLPVVVLLLVWWRDGAVRRRHLVLLVPLLLMAAPSALLTTWLERVHVGARGEEWSLGVVERWLVAGRALWFYLSKLLWPARLTFSYPQWRVDASVGWQHLFPAAFLALLAALWWLRGRIGRGPLTAFLVFAVTLSPALGFLNVYPMRYSYVADHFQYLASAGLIALGASAATRLLDGAGRSAGRLAAPLASALLLALGALVWRQSGIYENQETLWRDTTRKNPESWLALNNLGIVLDQRGNHEEATRSFLAALSIDPDLAKTNHNLGLSLEVQGRFDEAEHYFQRARVLDPAYPYTPLELGTLRLRRGAPQEALAFLAEAARLGPAIPETHERLGDALALLGMPVDAAEEYSASLDLRPDVPDVLFSRALALAAAGRADALRSDYERLRTLNPAKASGLAAVLSRRGMWP